METIESNLTETPAATRKGLVTRARIRIASVLAVAAAWFIGGIAPSFASPPDTDLTGGNGDTFITSLTSYFTDHVIVSVLALAAVTIGVGMLLRWGSKAAKRS
jgi:TctA family transporter